MRSTTRPMPSPTGRNTEGLYLKTTIVRRGPHLAHDSAESYGNTGMPMRDDDGEADMRALRDAITELMAKHLHHDHPFVRDCMSTLDQHVGLGPESDGKAIGNDRRRPRARDEFSVPPSNSSVPKKIEQMPKQNLGPGDQDDDWEGNMRSYLSDRGMDQSGVEEALEVAKEDALKAAKDRYRPRRSGHDPLPRNHLGGHAMDEAMKLVRRVEVLPTNNPWRLARIREQAEAAGHPRRSMAMDRKPTSARSINTMFGVDRFHGSDYVPPDPASFYR
jgi:hypothetical protein